MTIAEFPDLLRQITRRYRAALAANLGVLAALSVGSVGVLAWRLHAVGLDLPRVVGIPAALGVVAAAGLGWRLKRRWMAGMGTTSHLDRALGLQERLITAAEFAHRTPPPTLYPLLLDDAAQHFSREQVRLPRLVDRSGIVLAIILLLLLCWPGRGNVPMQLAQLPSTLPPIPPPQPQPPPEPQQQTPPQNQDGSSQSQSGGQQQAGGQQDQRRDSGGDQQGQPQGGGSNQQAGQSGLPAPPQNVGGAQADRQPSEATPQSQESDQQRRADQGRGNGQQAGGQRPDAADRQEQAGQAGRDRMDGKEKSQEPRRTPQTVDQKEQQERSRHDQTSGERGQQDGGGQRKGSAPQGNQQQAAGSDAQHTTEGAKPAGQQGSQERDQTTQKTDRGGGQAAMSGEITKAEIQQLLKEVSGELKQLQAQLAAANDQPHPEAGTSTDPELYGAAEALDRAKGSPLPVQLGTDTVETKAERPGGGVGQPAGKAASATPQTQAEDAQLSEQPLEETPAARQTIPPEYRPVFERLQQQRDATP